MKTIEILDSKNKPMTRSLATWLMELPEFTIGSDKVDRDLDDRLVQLYADRMSSGEFIYELVSLITCKCRQKVGVYPAETVFRMNGQHTANAFLRFCGDSNTERGGTVRVLQYAADTVEDMRELYSLQDRGRARTNRDVVNAHLAGMSGFSGVHKRILHLVVAGLQYWLNPADQYEMHRQRVSIDAAALQAKGDYVKVCSKIVSFLNEEGALNIQNSAMFHRVSVVAALLATFEVSPKPAHEFWSVVRSCLGVTSNTDPRYRLHNYLRGTTLANIEVDPRRRAKGKKLVNSKEVYYWCIWSWNLFCSGKESHSGPRIEGRKRPEPLKFGQAVAEEEEVTV